MPMQAKDQGLGLGPCLVIWQPYWGGGGGGGATGLSNIDWMLGPSTHFSALPFWYQNACLSDADSC